MYPPTYFFFPWRYLTDARPPRCVFAGLGFARRWAKKGNEQHNAAVIGGELCTAVQNYATRGSMYNVHQSMCTVHTVMQNYATGSMYNVLLILVHLVLWWGPKKMRHRGDSNSMSQCSVEFCWFNMGRSITVQCTYSDPGTFWCMCYHCTRVSWCREVCKGCNCSKITSHQPPFLPSLPSA